MTSLLILFAIVLGVNLMPAFGPPTWTIIVLFGLNSHMPVPAVVLIGAFAAATGRFLLAHGTRWLSGRTSEKTQRNLEAARQALERNKGRGILALGLFALSPLPSAQLFEAAGLTGIRLLPFTLAFFAGRLVSYSIYAGGAKAMQHATLADSFRESISSPLGVGLQVLMLAALVALTKINWSNVFVNNG